MVQSIVNFETKIISNNRITIPKEVTDKLQLNEGDRIRLSGEITKVNIVEVKGTVDSTSSAKEEKQ